MTVMTGMTGRVLIGVFEDEDHSSGDERGREQTWRSSMCSRRTVHGWIAHGSAAVTAAVGDVSAWLFGAVPITIFQFWASAVSWPINIGGKP
jgi:hypothetical protein